VNGTEGPDEYETGMRRDIETPDFICEERELQAFARPVSVRAKGARAVW